LRHLPTTIPETLRFIERRDIDWKRVRRTRYVCYQRFLYNYPGPIRNLHQTLIVVPAERYLDQALCEHDLAVTPYPADVRHEIDAFGNRVCRLVIPWIQSQIAFEVMIAVERHANGESRARVASEDVEHFRSSTELTASDGRIAGVAQELASQARDERDLAERISDWVANALSYGSGSTGVTTTAAQALQTGRGLCQDYAHLMLAICRAAGLPGRYVSGHMVAEGGSHAWVDVLVPGDDHDDYEAIAFDPTNRRQPNLGYTTVAVGRDYRDVSPSSGHYTAPYSGQLSFHKRAGLTLLEFDDGEVVRSGE
jgi:transglutaminase-like putative cysteine protease